MTVSRSVVGATKILATTSRVTSPGAAPPAACTIGATVATSSAESQLMIAPSPSRPARRSMPSRSAAIRMRGCCSGRMPSRKPLISERPKVPDIFSPAIAPRMKRTMSRTWWYGSVNGMPFQPSTMTFDEVPMPNATRPGAASASVATDCASNAGPRV